VLSGAPENALAESESTLQSSREDREHLEVLRSTGEGYQRVWEVCTWLPDRFSFCWWMANCKTSNKRSLAAEYMFLVRYYYQTAKEGALYKTTDGPAGRLADNPPNPDELGDLHPTVTELTVREHLQPRPQIWPQFKVRPGQGPRLTVRNRCWHHSYLNVQYQQGCMFYTFLLYDPTALETTEEVCVELFKRLLYYIGMYLSVIVTYPFWIWNSHQWMCTLSGV